MRGSVIVVVVAVLLLSVVDSTEAKLVQKSSSSSLQMTIRVSYPYSDGQTITLRGDNCGLSWFSDTSMTQTGRDEWSQVISCSSNSSNTTLHFKTLLNGQWQQGANENALISSSHSCVRIFPWFGSQRGVWSTVGIITSSILNNSRAVEVYLPPVVLENPYARIHDVLVMHDGQNIFNASTSFGGVAWMAQDTLDQMIIGGSMRSIVVAAFDNTPNRTDEYTYSRDPSVGDGGEGNLYLDFLEKEGRPWLLQGPLSGITPSSSHHSKDVKKKSSNNDDDDVRWWMLGSSLGGLISCYAGWTRSSSYWGVGCMSSSFWWNSEDFAGKIMQDGKPTLSTQFYIDTGSDEGSDPVTQVNQTKRVAQLMLNMGWTLNTNEFFYVAPGAQHNEYWWGKRFNMPMAALFPPTINARKC